MADLFQQNNISVVGQLSLLLTWHFFILATSFDAGFLGSSRGTRNPEVKKKKRFWNEEIGRRWQERKKKIIQYSCLMCRETHYKIYLENHTKKHVLHLLNCPVAFSTSIFFFWIKPLQKWCIKIELNEPNCLTSTNHHLLWREWIQCEMKTFSPLPSHDPLPAKSQDHPFPIELFNCYYPRNSKGCSRAQWERRGWSRRWMSIVAVNKSIFSISGTRNLFYKWDQELLPWVFGER